MEENNEMILGATSSSSGFEYNPPILTDIDGWETYSSYWKRLELMHVALLPDANQSYLYATRYFYFDGIARDYESHYVFTSSGEWKDLTLKFNRYVFYEISKNKYDQHLSEIGNEDCHFYKLEGPFADLHIASYSPTTFKYNGTLQFPNENTRPTQYSKITNYNYVGTTSYPTQLNYNNYTNTKRLLWIVNKVGDTICRQPLFNINYGRIRPLGNYDHPDIAKRWNGTSEIPQEGNPWNGWSINTIKCRIAETPDEFLRWIGSDEVHGDGPTSYPSGHSSQFWAMAMMITQLYGKKEIYPKDPNSYKTTSDNSPNIENIDQVRKFVHNAYKLGVGRTIDRFHWNSDTLYGRLFGSLVMPILNASNMFDNDSNESFAELINKSQNELGNKKFTYGTLNDINTNTGHDIVQDGFPDINIDVSPYSTWWTDFKTLINNIYQKSNVGINIPDNATPNNLTANIKNRVKYLWYMYRIGRAEIDGDITRKFNFFIELPDEYFPDISPGEDGYSSSNNLSWFPEVFDSYTSHSFKPKTITETVTYHGLEGADGVAKNTTYRKGIGDDATVLTGFTNIDILCSWLMALCEIEFEWSKSVENDSDKLNNQTKLIAAAYEIGGGRDVNLYDDYKKDYDPMYLRYAAGIIYSYERGKFSHNLMSSLRDTGINLDTNSQGGITESEATSTIGNTAVRDLSRTSDNYISGDTVVYGINTHYIFPNAPGPYVKNRGKLSRPYQKKQIGSSVLKNQYQHQSLFIIGTGGNTSGNETDIYVTLKLVNNTGVDIPITGEINIYFKALDGSSTHESLSMVLDGVSWSNHSSYIDKQNANGTFTQKSFKAGSNLTYENTKLIYGKNGTNGNHPSLYLGKTLNPECAIYVPSTKYGHVREYVTATAAFESPTTTLTNGCTIVLTATKYENPTDNGVS